MSDQKLDLSHHSPVQPTRLELDNEIKFRCHRGVSCWNECCARADVTLAPYDIIRLKEHPGVDSSEFLAEYSMPFEVDAHGIPGVKQRTDYSGAGLLPLHAVGKPDDEQHFLLIKKEHCKGHEETTVITIGDYRKKSKLRNT